MMIPTLVYYNLSLTFVYLILGTFITVKSLRYRVFNLTWAGVLILLYSLYFVGITLNFLGFITGIWNLILQMLYHGIYFVCLIFTEKTFYKYQPKRLLIITACINLVLGIICSTISMFGDTESPYINNSDIFDAWRFFLSNIIVTAIVYAPLLLATWREYKKARPKEPALSRRFLFYFTSVLNSIASSVFIEIASTSNSFLDLVSLLLLCTGFYSSLALYIVWISPEKGKHKDLSVDTSKTLKIGNNPIPETIITSIAIYRVIEDLGTTLSEITSHSVNACNGLLLLLIEKELGYDNLHRLDLAKLVPLFNGPLLTQLRLLNIPDPNAAISALKSRLAEKYTVFSMNLF